MELTELLSASREKSQEFISQFVGPSNRTSVLLREIRAESIVIRSIPVANSKYLQVWQRVRLRLKCCFAIRQLLEHITRDSNIQITGKPLLRGFLTAEEKKRFRTQYSGGLPFLVIHPDKSFKRVWNVLLGLLLLYVAFAMPFILAFIEVQDYGWLWWTELAVDFLFFCDVFVNANSAYYNSEEKLVGNRRTILMKYLKS